ncbi:uncharacterized protein LOC116775864 isoform X1 [Danaus plexippus]|uniref:uncharacterized protein LOC116775864 isoform X1 n=1 Tax=Danaus plexippus TaxID=13037 RepID=UPI0013C4144A|nr:uncharacterized protein LOC116775864 isoform X1 [Danaus plexippus]XP_032524756.1 uncharacterized protein LOC116775864 isoform X1 [Danaus plexippus plexippus]XP_061380396.1 uncharacterized protein LOC116775864 isoform X1 [Danaus plexippus]
MSGMTGASMLRTRRKDVNVKPNRKLDRKSSRGMLYENEELRLRTININAEVERGQSDIKKLKRENEQLKREISALRYEYDRLDRMLRERRSSPEHSDSQGENNGSEYQNEQEIDEEEEDYSDSASVCSACPECASADGSVRAVAFHDLSVVPEEGEQENKSGAATPCTCDECQKEAKRTEDNNQNNTKDAANKTTEKQTESTNNAQSQANTSNIGSDRTVDVLVHDAPNIPRYFQSIATPPFHVNVPPPPGFVIAPYQPHRFHNGGNIEDLLGDVQSSPTTIQTTYIQQNSIFMCNTRNIVETKCCCHNREADNKTEVCEEQTPKCYVTEKNIELTYDYPRTTPIPSDPNQKSSEIQSTTTEVASTVVFVEKKMPTKPKKFDFFFRSRSAPVGDHEEPIYATVNKLPRKLRRMELANLEKEVAYKNGEPDSSSRTEITLRTDSESQAPPPDDDTSRSEREKSTVPQRPESPKAKKRKRFSLTFKKRERKRREKKAEAKNGVKNGVPTQVESDNERLIEEQDPKHKHCTRHRQLPRSAMSSTSYSPRYKRDSYQEMTTSHSEHERTNSVCSSVNSLGSACTHKSRKLSVAPQDGSIPWCGCWGAGCV